MSKIGQWLNRLWCIYSEEYLATIKNNVVKELMWKLINKDIKLQNSI